MRIFLIIVFLFSITTILKGQSFKIDTIQFSGHSEGTYDLVIMAEGYRESNLDLFRSDARKVKDIMALNNAYAPLLNQINIFSISTPSTDEGISLIAENPSPNDPIQSSSIKNTFFGIYFLNSYRAFFLDEETILKARHFSAEHIPFSESVLILTNDEIGSGRASFSGVAAATRPDGVYPGSGEYVINHELAHSIAGLSDAYSLTPEEGFNKSSSGYGPTIRWNELLPLEDVGIHRQGPGVYIPNEECFMIQGTATFACPVCSQRIEKSTIDVSTLVRVPHRIFLTASDEEMNTQTFSWDPIPGASHYEVVFYAYWRDNVKFETVDTTSITFALSQEDYDMTSSYQLSLAIRAFNEDNSSYFARYSVASNPAWAVEAPIPELINFSKTSDDAYLLEFTKSDDMLGTMILLHNEEGIVSEIITQEDHIELRGLDKFEQYEVQLASVIPDINGPGANSALSDRIGIFISDVEEVMESDEILVYPNPTSEKLTIQLKDGEKINKILVTNLSGQMVLYKIIQSNNVIQLDIKDFSPGMYIINIEKNDKTINRKFYRSF